MKTFLEKTSTKITALVFTTLLAVSFQAKAVPTSFSESLNNINYEVEGQTYHGTFTGANLLSGSTVFDNSLYTISSASVSLTMLYAAGHQISLTIDGITLDLTPSASPQVITYNLTPAQCSYIQSHDGTFHFGVTVDCMLESAQLIVNTPASVPDGSSTAMLLGGAVFALALGQSTLTRRGSSQPAII